MIRPAQPQLLDLAAEMRPDWPAEELEGALVAAAASGWSWIRAFALTADLLADENATPRQLADAFRSPLDRQHPGEPSAEWHEARAGLDEHLAARRAS